MLSAAPDRVTTRVERQARRRAPARPDEGEVPAIEFCRCGPQCFRAILVKKRLQAESSFSYLCIHGRKPLLSFVERFLPPNIIIMSKVSV